MKIVKGVSGAVFQPVAVTILLESADEAARLFTIFNYTPTAEFFGEDESEQIRKILDHPYRDRMFDRYIALVQKKITSTHNKEDL